MHAPPQKYWTISFLIATAIIAVLGGHSYLVSSYTHEIPKWFDGFLRTAVTWYLWACFFPFIITIARRLRFERGTRLITAIGLILAATAIASLHATIQVLLNDWLFHPDRQWAEIDKILRNQFAASFLTRFFVCQAILSVCVALEFYQKARETEIRVAQMEAGLFEAQVESLKIQLDPQELFKSLKHLSKLMYKDLDEAESMIAKLGDDLRNRLVPLTFEPPGPDPVVSDKKNDWNETEVNFHFNSSPARKWLVITGIFTFLPIYFTIQRLIIHANNETTMNWPQQLLDCTGWYIWGLLTPFVLKISARYPLQRSHWPRLVMIHISALISMWLCATVAMVAVRCASNLGDPGFFETFPMSLARSPFWLDIVCYSTIVAVESSLRYHQRFEFGKIRTIRLNAQLARARLQALKMQLHPHFLYNSLNSLSELMREDPVAGEEMIHNLENFLHLTVHHNDEQEILFERELEFLQCYLAIENVRFQDRLTVKMEIDPQALQVKVPNLLLQPIVENAIRHGIAPRSKPGQVEIQAKRSNGVLKLSVRDNGPGFQKDEKKSSVTRAGLGLSNTRERLTQLYGDAHQFELTNAPEGGLIVSLEIPVKFNAKTAEVAEKNKTLLESPRPLR